MPTFSGQSPASATDGVSVQNVAGLITQKSQTLSGPVVTSDFTTTSSSLVDITGMSITLAATNNVASDLLILIDWGNNFAEVETFSFNCSATKEYVWLMMEDNVSGGFIIGRNADIASTSTNLGANNGILLAFGYLTGTTSGVVAKVQCKTAAGSSTITVKVGSSIQAGF